ncbi:MAG: cation:proton antiporter [Chitinophagaceae bacterium]|jgi:cell volume regulation protein A|nr:cation:proton antiporter [Chitinophagaceae bacterium]
MTTPIIITFCVLILLAYIFDLSSQKTKIPTVILLLILGWGIQQLTVFLKVQMPDLKPLLPIVGTVGLILIVLEGGLELEFNKSKLPKIKQASLSAFIPLVILSLIIGWALSYFNQVSFKTGIINALPLSIISSAIAIPSVQNLGKATKEFVVYESSLSDIFGVILFNFFTANEVINLWGVGNFFIQFIIILVISIIASVGLAILIKKINHHVKFLPIVISIILIYTLSKIFHLPALIFILIFGLLLNNLDELKHWKLVEYLDPTQLNKEIHKFKEIVVEMAFLVRTIFFLLFGYTINAKELLNINSFLISVGIISLIILVRYIYFKITRIDANPLLYISPRGLITILLFLSIPIAHQIPVINEALMLQIILLSAFVMMFGLVFNTKKTEEK